MENYTLLQSEVEKAGLLDRAYGYYAVLIITSLIGFFLSLYYVITIKSIPILVIWDIALAFFTVQLSGIMHDAGHRAIFKTSKMNDVVGFICAVLIVMGYSSWKTKHYLHHAHTNEEDVDPDLGLPILSFTVEKYRARKGVQKILSRYQSYLYYPIGLLVNFSVRITSMMYFWKNLKKYSVEIILFTIGLIVMYIVPFLVFDFIKAITLVIVFNFFSGVYLLNIFAPNHKGMPVLKRGKKISFLEQQIMTSRNVKGSAIVDYIYMGVNYQIEHHLFPNCPRNKLKLIVPYVKNLAQDMNLDYTEVGIIESNRIILSELHKITQT
ncbi:MAG TPA: acyl-CoA desaturase [Candidatus Andersenbacteria bacterium]|nr:acyl-CoA desaturase [Candidatus Andersenbacteria bacterium]